MYPTISHLIEDIFGVYIPLPIQTFGLWVAVAFICAAYVIKLELERKEKSGLISSTVINKIIGRKLTTLEIITSLISGFIIGFKLIEGVLFYDDLVRDPQSFILSSRGKQALPLSALFFCRILIMSVPDPINDVVMHPGAPIANNTF